tara:strand:- start:149 stop:340 length:192 start_codon:yes stop_codon:yes gene_type:complete
MALKGSRTAGKPRKSRTYGKGRVCGKDGCEKIMSQYNKKKFCFEHSPVTYPRVRGRDIIKLDE